jgi:hypothetical protein
MRMKIDGVFNEARLETKLTEALIELTDVLGFNQEKPEHMAAYDKAYRKIESLIEYGDNN